MRAYDLIEKKKQGQELSKDEIHFLVSGYVDGSIPDYQMSAFTMAVYFQGMTDAEMTELTLAMAHSGDMIDLSPIAGIKVDKHSTGGVGDKTSMVIGPIVASCGVKVAKMSGRGLGHTGGTLDKLEAIPGCSTSLDRERFFQIVNEIGLSIIGQTGNLVPADKKLYALRDVTATVDSMPLIASSIMSKKLAAGSDAILLDVKTGSGAFMKTLDDSIALAEKMVAIGLHSGRRMAALITDMDIPLGNAIGNSLEVIEAVNTLQGKGPKDFTEVCLQLAANMLYLADKGTLNECRAMAEEQMVSGEALKRFAQMVKAQGGNPEVIFDTDKFKKAAYTYDVKADTSGYIYHMDTEECGIASVMLGAGRNTKEDVIDPAAGIVLQKKTGDYVKEGEVLAVLYAERRELFAQAAEKLLAAYHLQDEKPVDKPLVFARVDKNGVQRFA